MRTFYIVAGLSSLIAAVLVISGCGDFFSRKPTELQAQAILQELSQVKESPNINNPVPEIYTQPPSRLEIKDAVRLFYFTRHHSAPQLAALVKEQLNVDSSANASTNQLVFFCKDHSQADTVEAYLKLIDVPPVQINIDCLILERFGSSTMDWETSIMAQNILGENITLGEQRGTFIQKSGSQFFVVDGKGNVLGPATQAAYPQVNFGAMQDGDRILASLNPAFPGASIRETERGKFGVDFGYWINKGVDGRQIRMLVDVLTSAGYLKILLNPTIETVNGRKASVSIKDYTPIEEVKTSLGGAASVYNITNYIWVEDTLTVTPFVYSDGSIGLITDIKIGSRSKPEGVVQRPIITERSINIAENRVLPGQSLVIGGMRKSEKRSVIRGVPFFKDLPLIGVLFSSKDFEEKGTEIIFILTPSISGGGQANSEIVRQIRSKNADPQVKTGLKQMLQEPFESGLYSSLVEKQAAQAELKRTEAELEREKALARAREQKSRADQAAAEAQNLRQRAQELAAKAQQAAQQAQQAAALAAQAQAESQIEQQTAISLEQQKQQALQLAQQAQQQAEAAAQQAQQAELKAAQLEQQAQQAAEDLRAAETAVQKAAQEAQAAKEKAQQRAEELERQRQELERQKELQRQQELERQRQLEQQRQEELERQKQQELQQRRQVEQEPQ